MEWPGCPNTFTILRNHFFSPPDGRNFLCGGSVDLFWNDFSLPSLFSHLLPLISYMTPLWQQQNSLSQFSCSIQNTIFMFRNNILKRSIIFNRDCIWCLERTCIWGITCRSAGWWGDISKVQVDGWRCSRQAVFNKFPWFGYDHWQAKISC